MRTRDWATVDFYDVLGVDPRANPDEIALAFRTLAKELHPDRVGDAAPESERFKSVTAAYDVLSDTRLRRSYDQIRVEQVPTRPTTVDTTMGRAGAGSAGTVTPSATGAARPVPMSAEVARRRGRRWIAAGIGVFLVGVLVTVLVVRLQVGDQNRRAGRVKTEATLLVSPTRSDVRFTTANGETVQVPEPTRVEPGTNRDGQQLAVLYRPDHPSDVIADESRVARDITLWIVALKLLVGGVVFLVVGIRRLRYAARASA